MAGPPNSVAVASPLPNTYFGNVFGAVARFPSAYQWSGQVQPFIPSPHYDVDSTGRTLPPQPVGGEMNGIPAFPIKTIIDRWRNNFVRNPPIRGGFENPLSWWKRQLPGIPERGM